MANIMSQLKLRNKTSRDGFDLSRRNAFTAKVGELLPVCCMEILPGDSVKARVQHFTRTMPVSTAAYTRIREYYDWYFVPTNLLWNKFNTFVTQMDDNIQHAVSPISGGSLGDTHPYFTYEQISYYIRYMYANGRLNMFGDNRAELTAKLLSYLGYGDLYDMINDGYEYLMNVNLNPFPLLAYQKIYSDYHRDSQWEKAFSPSFNVDYLTNSTQIDVSQIQQNSANMTTMFDLRYSNWHKDLFMGTLSSAQYGAAASIIGDISTAPSVTIDGIRPRTSNALNADANIIAKANETILSANGTSTHVSKLQFVNTALSELATSLGIKSFDIIALRQAEAFQKWKEITQSQQQDYKSQIEAHFGVSTSNAYSERAQYIGGSSSNLDISEVINQNITSDNPADIAGKGVGVGDGTINFKSDIHGYLMCIYHAVPLLDYAMGGVEKMLLKTMPTDYAIPELDSTGMVQVTGVEFTNSREVNSVVSGNVAEKFVGYAPRYYDYKTSFDRVNGAFTKSYSTWVAPIKPSYYNQYLTQQGNDADFAFGWEFRKVNPKVLNPIFAAEANSSVDTDQLLVNAHFDIKAVRNLDRNGLPY